MKENPLRQLLTRILHTPDKEKFTLCYINRGQGNNTTSIKVAEISQVKKGSFILSDNETQIPFHRILYVRHTNSQIYAYIDRRYSVGMAERSKALAWKT